MSKAMKLVIGGKEYTLRGEDEKMIARAAEEVNTQIESLKGKHLEESASTLSVLAALNIAEKYFKGSQSKEHEQRLIVNELNGIADFLINSLRKNANYDNV